LAAATAAKFSATALTGISSERKATASSAKVTSAIRPSIFHKLP
jgi:hypothetical protein